MVQEVSTKRHIRAFLDFPKSLYRKDPNWVCPLDADITSIFDSTSNPFFENGDCKRWLLYDDTGNVIGRIAAFHSPLLSVDEENTGGIGFFECIDDQKAANTLFDVAVDWLKDQGMTSAYAPINFGENDKYWGLLVQGFQPPSYGMNYHPPYYQQLVENYGFEKVHDQYTNMIDMAVPFPARFTKIADWVVAKKGYSFIHFEPAQLDKFVADFQEIYNDAWKDFDHFHPIDQATIRQSFKQMKPILDKKIIWFAYFEDEPIAFIVCMPDVNQILRHMNGKMHFWNKLRFMWIKNTKTIDHLRIIVMGCKHKFQNKGVESGLIRCLEKEVIPRNTIRYAELSWVADFNQKMIAIHEATGAKRYKVHRTYVKHFE